MTDETMYLRDGRSHGGDAPMLHSDPDCWTMNSSPRGYREATESEKDAYEECSVCTGDFEQGPSTRDHLMSLRAAAKEEAEDA